MENLWNRKLENLLGMKNLRRRLLEIISCE